MYHRTSWVLTPGAAATADEIQDGVSGADDVRGFRKRQATNLARLARVNRTLSRLDEYEAARAMPAEIQLKVRKPTLGRKALASLRDMLEGVLKEPDEMQERRN